MAYTFLDQQNKLSQLLGDSNTSTDDMYPLAARKKELSRGELHFARDSKILKNYVSDVIADKELDVPADWIETFVLVIDNKTITNDREIALADWEQYYAWAGTPPFYYFWEFSGTRKMKFLSSDSINGKTYKLWYFKKPTTELDANDDVSLIPDEYREASVYWAAAELLQQIGKNKLAAVYRNVYASYVSQAEVDAKKQYIEKEHPRPDLEQSVPSETDHQGQGPVY